MDETILNPIIPYVGSIGTFTPQKLIKIQGTIPENGYGFEISLQCGPNTFPNEDIALHMSVQLPKGQICLNSFRHGIWGEEISKSSELIQPDEKFEIVVLCQENQYKVTINGEDYYSYPHIIHYDMVSHLSITGDLSIIQISYESASVDQSTKNVGESAETYDADEPLSSSKNTLIPADHDIEYIKRGCERKVICYVFIILFVMFGVSGGLIYWYCTDDGTNIAQIKNGFRGTFGWYKNDSNEKP